MHFLIHPLVVHFPVALWLTSILFDMWFWWRGDLFAARVARILIGLGLVGAVASIGTGFYDFIRLARFPIGQAFLDLHTIHSWLSYAATAVYAAVFALRWQRPEPHGWLRIILVLLGAGLIALTGWYGGELRRVM